MDTQKLTNSLDELEAQSRLLLQNVQSIKKQMDKVIEKNAELEIENQHLHERLQELEPKKEKRNKGLSKSRKNLEKLYEQGFHVCNVDNMYGSRRLNNEPCVFCQDVIYGERKQK